MAGASPNGLSPCAPQFCSDNGFSIASFFDQFKVAVYCCAACLTYQGSNVHVAGSTVGHGVDGKTLAEPYHSMSLGYLTKLSHFGSGCKISSSMT